MGILTNNIIWNFFKSVKLALFTFFILAFTSIIGTVIPQNEAPEIYVKNYGANTAKLFDMLGIPDMYNAWWFLALLIIFSINLIVCSINRFPDAWKRITADIVDVVPERIKKRRPQFSFVSSLPVAELAPQVEGILADGGWKPKKSDQGDAVLFGAKKGAWTRLGVYTVHSSILIIFIGAIIGSLFGYKASIMLPEMGVTDKVFERSSGELVPLGFSIRCNRFTLSYYDNGAPKEYRSDLTVLENGKEIFSQAVIVNDPLHYKGITFYQSSYNGYNEFLITLKDQKTEIEKTFRVAPGRKMAWPQTGISFGIVNHQPPNQWGQYRLKIWFSDGKGAPSQFWLDDSRPVSVQRADTTYLMSSKQFFATGLQIAKDPGVWYVYIGCTLMLLGLMIAFFLSHKKIWAYIEEKDGKTSLVVSGTSNKNKIGLEKDIAALNEKFQINSEKLQLNKE